MKASLIKSGDTYILAHDGKPCICPFRNPFPQQGKLGGIELISFQCNSQCALFELEDRDLKDIPVGVDLPAKELTLNCGSGRNIFPIEVKEPDDSKGLKIIK